MDIVQRPLQADGIKRLHGEIVDAGAWKHAPKLREQRYISPYSGEPLTCALCGRMFTEEAFKDHVKKDHPGMRGWKPAILKKEEKIIESTDEG